MEWRKSSRSGSGNGANCVEVGADWRKSSRSGDANGNCIEVSQATEPVLVRDTKDRHGGTLVVTPAAFAAFTAAVQAGTLQ